MPICEESLPVREARRLYFDANGFGDGGYDAAWVKLQLGPVPFAFPNSAQRVRSVRLHDLHHVATGYATDVTGEAEIGAWEIGGSCRDHYAAWILNLLALSMGLLIAPSRMWRAFVRGRRSRNLYEGEYRETILDQSVGELRMRLGLGRSLPTANAPDYGLFALWSVAALATGTLALLFLVSPLFLLGRLLLL